MADPEAADHKAQQAIQFALTCRKNGLVVGERMLDLLRRYVALLSEWNEKVNLVSRRDTENLWSSHILHSISALFFLDIPHGARLLDLGSGGGLPGIPISIVRPDLRVVLVDSIAKKTVALSAMVSDLGLGNVEVTVGRAEQLGSAHAGKYGVVLARAVAPLEDLLKWSSKLFDRTVPGGPILVAYKGGDIALEVDRAKVKRGAADIRVIPLVFAGSAEAALEDKKLVVVRIH